MFPKLTHCDKSVFTGSFNHSIALPWVILREQFIQKWPTRLTSRKGFTILFTIAWGFPTVLAMCLSVAPFYCILTTSSPACSGILGDIAMTPRDVLKGRHPDLHLSALNKTSASDLCFMHDMTSRFMLRIWQRKVQGQLSKIPHVWQTGSYSYVGNRKF